MDQDGDAGGVAQLALHAVQLAAVEDVDAGGQALGILVLVRIIAGDHDAGHAFGRQLACHHRHVQIAVDMLAAGHRHRVVVQDLVSDVHFSGHRGADGQDAGVEVGAVAQVGEDMAGGGERRLAQPGDAFAAHLGEGLGAVGLDPVRHVVAADAGHRAAAVRHLGAGVVRAAGAVVRHAGDGFARLDQLRLFFIVELQAVVDHRAVEDQRQPAGDGAGDHRRGQLAGGRQQPIAVRQRPFALFGELAHHPRAHVVAPVVQLFLQLVFDDLAFFLHHQNLFQALGELAHAFRLQRPHHAHLEDAQADFGRLRLADAQVVQRLHHVQIALAAGDDAEAGLGRIQRDVVELVFAGIGQRTLEGCFANTQALHAAA